VRSELNRKVFSLPVQSVRKINFVVFGVNEIPKKSLCKFVNDCGKKGSGVRETTRGEMMRFIETWFLAGNRFNASRNPQNLVLFQLRASGQLLKLLQSAHAPARQERQKAQLTRLQHLMGIQQ